MRVWGTDPGSVFEVNERFASFGVSDQPRPGGALNQPPSASAPGSFDHLALCQLGNVR
jgi:hypothetical protein